MGISELGIQKRQDFLFTIEIEVGVVSLAPLIGEDDGLPALGGSGYEPARVGDRLEGGGGALFAVQKEKRLLRFFLLVQVHYPLLLGEERGLLERITGRGR